MLQSCGETIEAAHQAAAAAVQAQEHVYDMPAVSSLSETEAGYLCKALYRRSQALQGQGNVAEARTDLLVALRVRPSDATLRQELKSLNKTLKERAAQDDLKQKTEEGRRRRQPDQSTPATADPTTASDSLRDTGQTTDVAISKSVGVQSASSSTPYPASDSDVRNTAADADEAPTSSVADDQKLLDTSSARRKSAEPQAAELPPPKIDLHDSSLTSNGGSDPHERFCWSQTLYEVRSIAPLANDLDIFDCSY